jgi:hypothetical protein
MGKKTHQCSKPERKKDVFSCLFIIRNHLLCRSIQATMKKRTKIEKHTDIGKFLKHLILHQGLIKVFLSSLYLVKLLCSHTPFFQCRNPLYKLSKDPYYFIRDVNSKLFQALQSHFCWEYLGLITVHYASQCGIMGKAYPSKMFFKKKDRIIFLLKG